MPGAPHYRGLTLTELLVVIGIIVILTGVLAAALMWPRKQRQQLEASQTLQAMTTALLKMKQDIGIEAILGKNKDGKKDAGLYNNGELLKELCPTQPQFAPFTPRFNSTKTVYMEFKQHQFKGGSVCDPWGQPYRYIVYYIQSNRWPYEIEALYSAGPDGKSFNADDVVTVLSRTPVPASGADKNQPAYDVGHILEIVGWQEKPEAWP